MKRDDVIKRVADVVGPLHSVDLKNFDLLILVEIYRVSRVFDRFSRKAWLTIDDPFGPTRMYVA